MKVLKLYTSQRGVQQSPVSESPWEDVKMQVPELYPRDTESGYETLLSTLLNTKVQESALRTMHCEQSINHKDSTVEVFIPREFRRGSLSVTEFLNLKWTYMKLTGLSLCKCINYFSGKKISFNYAILDMKHSKPDQATHTFTKNQQINNIRKLREASGSKALGSLSFTFSLSPCISFIPLPL